MQKYTLKDSENIFAVSVSHNVSLRVFAIALADKFYNDNDEFPKKLTKKQGEKILKKGLFFYGCQGMFEDGYFEASYEEGERYNQVLEPAYEWVKEKYEWLKK